MHKTDIRSTVQMMYTQDEHTSRHTGALDGQTARTHMQPHTGQTYRSTGWRDRMNRHTQRTDIQVHGMDRQDEHTETHRADMQVHWMDGQDEHTYRHTGHTDALDGQTR